MRAGKVQRVSHDRAPPMSPDRIAWFSSALAFAFAMSATPGPNNAMLTASGANWGLRRTLPHLFGVATGFPAMVLAVGLGAGGLLQNYPFVQHAMRWAGASYMVWLAAKIARADPAPDAKAPAKATGQPLSYFQAALFQWVNPKAWVIAMGGVVTYTTGGAALVSDATILALMFLVVTLPVTFGWTLVGVGAGRMLRTRRSMRRFNFALAALLVLSLVPLLLGE
jgi:threonine/homoserine/homoserine lactone efflux protein